MECEEIIAHVEEVYVGIVSDQSQKHFNKKTIGITPKAYYEYLLNAIITKIGNGILRVFSSIQHYAKITTSKVNIDSKESWWYT
jgi:hypothetical protein